MREEVWWLTGPVIFLTWVALFLIFAQHEHHLKSQREQLDFEISLAEMQKELDELTGKVKSLENAVVFTAQRMTFVKKLAHRVEKNAREKLSFAKMCGVFTPCDEHSNVAPIDTSTMDGRVID